MKTTFYSIALIVWASLFLSAGCQKEENDTNVLGGETNIPLTEVGRVSDVILKVGDNYLPDAQMTVVENNNGVVKYHVVIDLTGHPDSTLIATLVPPAYKDAEGRINTDLRFRITSEGFQDYFQNGSPWTVVRYSDPVGTNYDIKNPNDGSVMRRIVTEKTGVDDFPYGFYYIKTSKVEQVLDPADAIANKITYRANHRFGLVYIEVELKSGETASAYIFPQGI